MAAVGMVITFYLVCGLGPGVRNPCLHPRITDDMFCIAFDVTGKTKEEVDRLKALLQKTNAHETDIKDI